MHIFKLFRACAAHVRHTHFHLIVMRSVCFSNGRKIARWKVPTNCVGKRKQIIFINNTIVPTEPTTHQHDQCACVYIGFGWDMCADVIILFFFRLALLNKQWTWKKNKIYFAKIIKENAHFLLLFLHQNYPCPITQTHPLKSNEIFLVLIIRREWKKRAYINQPIGHHWFY